MTQIGSSETELPSPQCLTDLGHVSGRIVIETTVHVVVLVLHRRKMNLTHRAAVSTLNSQTQTNTPKLTHVYNSVNDIWIDQLY